MSLTLIRRRALVVGLVAAVLLGAVCVVGLYLYRHRGPEQLPPTAQVTAAGSIEALELGDGDAQIAVPKRPVSGLVVFVHGAGQRSSAPTGDTDNAPTTAALLHAGWAVASADADGNAWGNPDSVNTYRRLVDASTRRLGAVPVVVLAESMGGLAGVQIAETDARVRAFVGIYPVCNLRSVYQRSNLREQIDVAYPDGAAGPIAVLSPPPLTRPVPVLTWGAITDTVVPAQDNARVCAAQATAAGARGEWVPTAGEHGDPSNFDPSRVVAFFAAVH